MAKKHKQQLLLIDTAAQKYYSEDYNAALGICKLILKNNPKEVNALNLSGIIYDKLGKKKQATKLFLAALKITPDNPELCTNLATTYIDLEEIENANKYLQQAISFDPNYTEALYNLGNICYRKGDFGTAKAWYQKTIKLNPQHIRALNNLADVLRKQGEIDQSIEHYNQVLLLEPNYIESLLGLASLKYDNREYTVSEELLRRIIALNPNHIRANYLLGISIFNHNKYSQEASKFLMHSLHLNQDQADVKSAIGAVLHINNEYDESLKYLNSAIEMQPEYADAYNTKGLVLHELGDIETAKQCYLQAIEYKPDFVEALNNYGNLIGKEGELNSAIEYFEKALSIRSDSKSASTNLALTKLLISDYSDAWNYYRFRASVSENEADFCPESLPLDLTGKSILLIKDQGIGDELFFLRFLPAFIKRGATVSYHCCHKLLSILSRTNCFQKLSFGGFNKSKYDYAISVGDLPYILQHQSETDSPPPFPLTCHPTLMNEITTRLTEFGPPPYVGFSWQAGGLLNNKNTGSYFKTFDINKMESILVNTKGTLISLQRNPKLHELDALSKTLNRPILNVDEYNNDLERMLCVLNFLDRYIAVSNTNVHLRAGLGKQSHVLVPYPSEWRWMEHGKQSHWFPNCNIYRQSKTKNWDSAIHELLEDLSPSQ